MATEQAAATEQQSKDMQAEEEAEAKPAASKEPVIGVLCIDQATALAELWPDATSYVAASYVAYLQQAGAKVVPIWLSRDSSYYVRLMGHLNGVLLPGGAVFMPYEQQTKLRSDCVAAVELIYKEAVRLNAAGQYFPVWGTCLGMQLMLHHAAEGMMRRVPLVAAIRESRPLQLTRDYGKSRLFAGVSEEMYELLVTTKVAHHFHRYAITRRTLREARLQDDWLVLGESEAEDGPFVTLVEHRRYPFYACQFHPERVAHERGEADEEDYDRSEEVCQAAGYFAEFFVAECRKSRHRFASPAEEERHLIGNFPLTQCPAGMHWQAVYQFGDHQEYSSSVIS